LTLNCYTLFSFFTFYFFTTVLASKRSAIGAQSVYFLHSTMPSVTCLRLSDISVICHVTYFQFPIYVFLPCRSARPHSSVLGLPNIGHRTLPKIWRGFLYGAYSTYFELIRTEKWKQYRDHLVLNFGRSVIIAYSWRSEVARR